MDNQKNSKKLVIINKDSPGMSEEAYTFDAKRFDISDIKRLERKFEKNDTVFISGVKAEVIEV